MDGAGIFPCPLRGGVGVGVAGSELERAPLRRAADTNLPYHWGLRSMPGTPTRLGLRPSPPSPQGGGETAHA